MSRFDIFMAAISTALIGVLFWAAFADIQRFEAFKAEHHCKKVSESSASTINTVSISANGQLSPGIGASPGKTGWACDDGVIYYR